MLQSKYFQEAKSVMDEYTLHTGTIKKARYADQLLPPEEVFGQDIVLPLYICFFKVFFSRSYPSTPLASRHCSTQNTRPKN